MASGEARVEDGAERLPRVALEGDHIGRTEEFCEVGSDEAGFGQGLRRGHEFRGEFRVGDEEPAWAEGPPVDVEGV